MKIYAHGSVTIVSGHTMVIVNLEEVGQVFPLVSLNFNVEIAPDLIAKGVNHQDPYSIYIPGHTTIVINTKPIFKRMEVVPLTKDEAKYLFLSLVSDPDLISAAKQFGSTAKNRSQNFIENVNTVLDELPEDGPATQLLKHLEEAQWAQAILEILSAIQVALPEKWETLSDLITSNGVTWLTGKLK